MRLQLFSPIMWMASSTRSASVPTSMVVLPESKKPPVVASRVTENPALVRAREAAVLSSLDTMAMISFCIMIPPLRSYGKSRKLYQVYYSRSPRRLQRKLCGETRQNSAQKGPCRGRGPPKPAYTGIYCSSSSRTSSVLSIISSTW